MTISAVIACGTPRHAAATINVTGNWQVLISVAEETITGKGALTQSGETVTGWIGPDENDPIPVTGNFKNGKLMLKTLPQEGRTVAFDKVELNVDGGTMYGVINNGSHGKGTIKFIRSK